MLKTLASLCLALTLTACTGDDAGEDTVEPAVELPVRSHADLEQELDTLTAGRDYWDLDDAERARHDELARELQAAAGVPTTPDDDVRPRSEAELLRDHPVSAEVAR